MENCDSKVRIAWNIVAMFVVIKCLTWFSLQMKPGGEEKGEAGCEGCDCRCNLPSLGQLQKKFLTLIAELFYKHGKFVSIGLSVSYLLILLS